MTDDILHEWVGFIDDIDDETIWLRLHDNTDPDEDGEFEAEVPRRHFAHMEEYLSEGVYVTMRVTKDGVQFSHITPSEEERQRGKEEMEELLSRLAQLREEAGD